MENGLWILLIGAIMAYLLYEMTRALTTRWLHARRNLETGIDASEASDASAAPVPASTSVRGQDMRVTGLMLAGIGGLGLALAYALGYGVAAVSAYWAGWICLAIGVFLFVFGLCVRSLAP